MDSCGAFSSQNQNRRPLKEGAHTNFGTPLALGILIVLQLANFGALAQEPQYAAVIQELTGDVFLIATHGAQGQKVDPAKSEGYVLYVGETLHLNQDAYVKISAFNHHKEVVQRKGPCDYTVPDKATRAVLQSLDGGVVLVAPRSNEPQNLKPENSKGRSFRAGDVLRLGQSASVSLDIYYDDKEVIEKTGECDYTVPQTGAGTDVEKIIDEIQKIAGIGGRTAFGGPPKSAIGTNEYQYNDFVGQNYALPGESSATATPDLSIWHVDVFSPAPDSAVWPEHLEFKWATREQGMPASLTILDQHEATIWSEELEKRLFIEGVWHSAEAENVLAKHEGETVYLRLVAHPEIIDWYSGHLLNTYVGTTVRFRVLSPSELKALNSDLSALGTAPQLLTHILRARVFEKYGMFNQVADEYEEALKLAPNSRSVLQAAISAHHRTGNVWRENELLRRAGNTEGEN